MSSRISKSLLLALLIAASAAPTVSARGDLLPDKDSCVLKIGPDLIYFAAYQPGGDTQQHKFCEDVPRLGETIFVFDYAAPELREMKAGFRILQSTGDGLDTNDIEAATTASLAPQIYPKGTFSFAHVFTQPGDFVGVVTVDGAAGEHWTARFPFSVAKRRFDVNRYYLIAAAGLLAILLFVSSRLQADPARR